MGKYVVFEVVGEACPKMGQRYMWPNGFGASDLVQIATENHDRLATLVSRLSDDEVEKLLSPKKPRYTELELYQIREWARKYMELIVDTCEDPFAYHAELAIDSATEHMDAIKAEMAKRGIS